MTDLGPQYDGDDRFTARMRVHQSWYRATVLRWPPGVGPEASSTSTYGNMLPAAAGEQGLNFLTPAIAALAVARQRENPAGIRRHRLLCNMLSSQPMAFNLFGPAALDPAFGAVVASALVDDRRIRRVVSVTFEHAPEPRFEYLDDATSFDVFFDVEDDDGARGFIAIETKLTEPFSPTRYAIDERPAYRRWFEHPDAPWRGVPAAALDRSSQNQLFRNHALAFALRTLQAATYSFGYSVVVHHEADLRCGKAVSDYNRSVGRTNSLPFVVRPLGALTLRLQDGVARTPHEGWLRDFETRYLDFGASGAVAQGGAP